MILNSNVAILILLELTLQSFEDIADDLQREGRNPYFIGINSAIKRRFQQSKKFYKSQSLFYWN